MLAIPIVYGIFRHIFYQSSGNTGIFTFVDASISVVEEHEEIATVCVGLGGLKVTESLGCPVTVTMQLHDGDNASMF